MMTYFCPGCWSDALGDLSKCPHCYLAIASFWNPKDWIEKLLLTLEHREPSAPLRAAFLLGRSRDPRAIPTRMQGVEATSDVYLAKEAVRALGEIGGRDALELLGRIAHHHQASMVHDEAQRVREEKEETALPERELERS